VKRGPGAFWGKVRATPNLNFRVRFAWVQQESKIRLNWEENWLLAGARAIQSTGLRFDRSGSSPEDRQSNSDPGIELSNIQGRSGRPYGVQLKLEASIWRPKSACLSGEFSNLAAEGQLNPRPKLGRPGTFGSKELISRINQIL
jgi:hypothetical protein